MFVVTHKKAFLTFFGLLVALSLVSVWYFGLRLGIDFTGGSLLEIEFLDQRPDLSIIKDTIGKTGLTDVVTQAIGERGIIIRTKNISDNQKTLVLKNLSNDGVIKLEEKRFDSIGPVIGEELKTKAVQAIVLVIIFIVLFITFAFRQVSFRIRSWKYGIVTIITLVHDVFVPLGIFALLGHYYGYEVDTLFVTAILTILGYSVHDTIVVFDRIRENLKLYRSESLDKIAGDSLRQTIGRSINTSLTVVLSLLALYFFGGETTRLFALTLTVGVVAGTLSSIFLAVPLLVLISGNKKK